MEGAVNLATNSISSMDERQKTGETVFHPWMKGKKWERQYPDKRQQLLTKVQKHSVLLLNLIKKI